MFLKKETVCSLIDTKDPSDLGRIFPCLDGRTQDHHVHRNPDPFAQEGVFCHGDEFAVFFRRDRPGCDLGHLAPDKYGPFFLAPAVEFLIAFSKASLVDVKIIYRGVVAHLFFD